MKNRRIRTMAAALALSLGVVGVAAARSTPGAVEKSATSDAASGPNLVKRIGAAYPIRFVFYTTETVQTQKTGSTWSKLAGSNILVKVGGPGAIIFGRFTAESLCSGTSGYCSARIAFQRVGAATQYMEPNAGRDLLFDDSAGEGWESSSIEQVIPANVAAGDFNVWVEISTNGPTLTVDNWTFTAQAAW